MLRRFSAVVIVGCIFFVVLSGCFWQQERVQEQPHYINPFTSLYDIPGVTEEEIADVERLRRENEAFVYGMITSTDAFISENGEIGGYAALFCRWLTDLFDIPFEIELYPMNILLEKLDSFEVDFSGVVMITEEHHQRYILTDVIAERRFVLFRIAGSRSLSQIAAERTPRFAFVENAPAERAAAAVTEPGAYEPVWVRNAAEAYQILKDGEADAFFASSNNDALFVGHGDVVLEEFFPLIFNPVAMATANPDLESIISIVTKAQRNNASNYLNYLYNLGYHNYTQHKLFARLTDEERAYIAAGKTIPIAAFNTNYPLSFYDTRNDEWQGIFFDILEQITALTGLIFNVIHDETATWPDMNELLISGDAAFVPQVGWTRERADYVIWSDILLRQDNFALISKTDYRNIELNDIANARVGLARGTVFEEVFNQWFPTHRHTTVYDTQDLAFDGLMRDEVDLVMSTQQRLMYLTHYREMPEYKVNFLFDHYIEIKFGFNRDELLLRSIIDKTLTLIDTERVFSQWVNRTYDFRIKMIEAQTPWLIGVIILFISVIVLVVLLLLKTRSMQKSVTEDNVRLTLMLDTSPLCTVIWDKNFKMIDCNEAAVKLFGLKSKQEYKDTFLTHCSPEYQPDGQRSEDIAPVLFSRAFKKGYSVFEWMHKMPYDNTPVPTEATLVRAKYGNADVIVGYTRDLREHKAFLEEIRNAHDEMRIARDIAEDANRTKSIFLANMSHEIRTPMNSIIGFSELAQDEDTSPKTNQYLINISDSAKWLLNIINDILDVAKIESGKIDLERIPFDLHDVVSECQAAILPRATEKGLTVNCNVEFFSRVKFMGDPIRLRQVLLNLMSNAIKFTSVGAINLYASIIKSDETSVSVSFEIKDSGIGMSPEQIKNIFEPFIQADVSVTREYGGTGLGLPIAKNIIGLMGGTLNVESVPKVGSCFYFDLTFDLFDETTDSPAHTLMLNDIDKPMFKGEVLVCEDNFLNQQVICDHLARVGLKTAVAKNGKEGVDIILSRRQNIGDNTSGSDSGSPDSSSLQAISAKKKPFDLIFMDIHMPVMDGLEAMSIIAGLEIDTPVVALTANIMSNDLERYKASGMVDYLGKPFTSQELWKCLVRYLPVENYVTVDKDQQSADEEKSLEQLRIYFAKSNKDAILRINQALYNNDIKLAHRLVHTLKSSAGQIGEQQLKKTAAEAEDLLADDDNRLTDEKFASLETELNSVLEKLAPLVAEADEKAKEYIADTEKTWEIIGKLEPLLISRNAQCIGMVDEIRTIEGAGDLAFYVEDFEFVKALDELAKLKERLEHFS